MKFLSFALFVILNRVLLGVVKKMLDTTDLSFGLRLGLDLALHLDMEQNHAYESETKIGIGKCESLTPS